MRELFDYFDEYKRNYIKSLLIQYTNLYKKNPAYYGSGENSDKILDILNGYLAKTVKPQWFSYDINFIKDMYEYISFICTNIEEFPHDHSYKLLMPEDIISDSQKNAIKDLLSNSAFNTARNKNGTLYRNMDINYIDKAAYKKIILLLENIIKQNTNHAVA